MNERSTNNLFDENADTNDFYNECYKGDGVPHVEETSHQTNRSSENISVTDSKSKSVGSSYDSEEATVLFDDLMEIIGEFGPYQFLIFLTFTIGMMIEVVLVMTYVFAGATPSDFYCKVPSIGHLNLSESLLKNITVNGTNQCAMYDRDYSNWTLETVNQWRNDPNQFGNRSVPCKYGWIFDRSVYEETIVTQWNLVCDDVWKSSFVYSAVGIGQLLGALMWGILIDKFGRRWPYVYAMVAMVLLAGGASFSPRYYVYCILQFVMGIHTVAAYSVGTSVAVEITGIKVRGHLSTAVNYFWSFGYMLLPLIAYYVRSWFKLQRYISIASLILLSLLIFIKESPRWLYTHDKKEDANAILRQIAKCNKKEFPENTHYCWKMQEAEVKQLFIVLWILRRRLIQSGTKVCRQLWKVWEFSNSLVYFGISLYLPTLSESPYLNFFISGAVELPGYIIAQLSIAFLGRKKPLSCVMMFAGICLYILLIIEKKDLQWTRIMLVLIGKMCVTASWSMAICFTNELYPTMLRGRGLLTCTLFGNLGNALSPQINLLGQLMNPIIPPFVFASLSVISSTICLLLPETKGMPLYDTVEEMRNNVSIKSF
ncbi:hypothetical protein HELRODRAFT_74952 [Helobdella robusta]|uniref:Major facilitator superfamily (MFS) profile domain-containing protein n=1 Tax=Helobdella robusta TaxID=6412 RepID=T1G1Y5_HELRO|nr:hypothetical protein HELRODRAFT_74952 [Helobdella robusta]ESO08452.1 hypothetical protein HELRODRAFT_74952 [Helobdella robusta]